MHLGTSAVNILACDWCRNLPFRCSPRRTGKMGK